MTIKQEKIRQIKDKYRKNKKRVGYKKELKFNRQQRISVLKEKLSKNKNILNPNHPQIERIRAANKR